jgi:hypothetical protein
MNPERPATFDEFYRLYLDQHRHPATRAFHLAAKVLMAGALAVAVLQPSWLALLAAPFLGVLPCWLGHLLFDRNQPTSWTRPSSSLLGTLRRKLRLGGRDDGGGRAWWSFVADLRMCAAMLGFGADPLQR